MDHYWQAVSDFLNSNAQQGWSVVGPIELREIFPVKNAYADVMASDAEQIDALVLHKSLYQRLDRGFIRAAIKRLSPSFANEVFIVLTARGAVLDDSNPHIGSLKIITAWAEAKGNSELTAARQDITYDPMLRRISLARWWDALRSDRRALEPLRLTRFGRKTFSQNDEDGITLEVFNRIGVKSRRFVEFGVETGVECNTALLLCAGWSGLWLDGTTKNVIEAKKNHGDAVRANRLTVVQAMITAENINQLLIEWCGNVGSEIDLLSIDIDQNDYWVWKAIEVLSPRVVIIEYNASYPPPLHFIVPYRSDSVWNTTNYYGASLSTLEKLGCEKGYALVGCCLAGVNAFFVREDELNGSDGNARFHAPFTATEHYEPPRYELANLSFGHKPGFGPNAVSHAIAESSLKNSKPGDLSV